MRVKLQYSVDLEEVPAETRRLFSRANAEIHGAGDNIDDIFVLIDSSTDYESVLDSIKSARLGLAEADFRLGDAESILYGYMQAKYTPPQEHTDLGQLQEKLENLKDSMPDAEEEQDE